MTRLVIRIATVLIALQPSLSQAQRSARLACDSDDGGIYISDDKGGRIWRVVWRGD